MTLIGLRSVEKFYGGRAVLSGLDLKVNAGARIGLVGTNGAGKSTVLRILAGTEEVDGGEVVRRALEVASLPQYVEGDERTPMEVVRAARPEIRWISSGSWMRAVNNLARRRWRPTCAGCSVCWSARNASCAVSRSMGGPGFEGEVRAAT